MSEGRIAMGACFGAVALLWAGSVVAGPGLDEKCQALKNNEAGKLAACLEKAELKLVMTAGKCSVTTATVCYREGDCAAAETCNKDLTVYNTLVAACGDKFAAKWQVLEDKFGIECPTTGDRADVQAPVETCKDTVSVLLDPASCRNRSGAEVGGSCWFLGQGGQSCDTVCAAVASSYDQATRDYAGSGGTLQHCNEVLDALGAPAAASNSVNIGVGLGCIYYTPGGPPVRLRDTQATVSGEAELHSLRACACQP